MPLKIRDGGVKTLWTLSLPLILSFLSALGMLSVDRLFLARYSSEALSAAVSGGLAAWALTFGGQTLSNVSGIFVAQHNGAERYRQIGRPVWQAIWLSLALTLPFVIAAIWLGPWIFSGSAIEKSQVLYYRWTLATSPIMCLLGALNGFFIGRGKTYVITWLTLLGNLVNLILDPILIFGWGPFPSLGLSGAAIATGIGLSLQCCILFYLFVSKKNHSLFGTHLFGIRWRLMWDMIRIGAPEAIAMVMELSAWAAFYRLMSQLSTLHILVASVGQSMLMVFFFFGIGMEQGIASLCGNLIGADLKSEVSRAFRSGLKIVGVFAICLFALFIFGGNSIVNLFLQSPEHSALSVDEFLLAQKYVRQGCFVIVAYIILETVRCLLYGILRAAGDTRFILIMSVLATWALLLMPTYLLMSVWQMPVYVEFWIWLSFAFLTTWICYIRFARGGWQERKIFLGQESQNSVESS